LNAALLRRAIGPRYATLTYATLAPDGRLRYSNAGHNPPLLLTANGITALTEGGPILGLFDDAQFPEASLTLAPGDTLLSFSDGLTDAVSPDGSDFGMDRLLTVAAENRTSEPAALLAQLLHTIEVFVGGAPPNDDVTVAVTRYTGPPQSC
jgi:sigma-B regulation protein RsbU (phosphoserine phosphatase)